MPLTVTFLKTVTIANTRLAFLYFFLATASLCFVLYNFITTGAYLKMFSPGGRVYFWVDRGTWDISSEQASQVNNAFGQLDICNAPSRFEYCDVPNCAGSNFVNMTCMDFCTDEILENCIDTNERWYKEDKGIFFPTYFNETIRTFSSEEITTTNKQRILKGVEEMMLSFDHEYFFHTSDEGIHDKGSNKDAEGKLLTVLLDKDDNEIHSWLPGKSIALPLRTMLGVAGLFIDKVNGKYGPNYLEGAEFPHGILPRLAGAELGVELWYANFATKLGGELTRDWDGPVCYIRISSAVAWTSKPILDFLSTSTQRLRYYHGLRVRFTSAGAFGYFDVNRVLNTLTSALVFLGVAKRLTKYFATNCLGAVSRIYKRFINQKASLEQDACGLAARMTSHSSAFLELRDQPQGISKDRLERRFERIFRNEHDLDRSEIEFFTDYVYKEMCGSKNSSVWSKKRRKSSVKEGECIEGRRFDEGKLPTVIDVESYARACAIGEMVSLKSLIEIFDVDRKKSFLERLFMPDSVRQILEEEEKDKTSVGDGGTKLHEESESKQKRDASAVSPGELARKTFSTDNLGLAPVAPSSNSALAHSSVPEVRSTSIDIQEPLSPHSNEEDDILESLKHMVANHGQHIPILADAQETLKGSIWTMQDNYAEINDMVQSHRSVMDRHQANIEEVQASIKAMKNQLLEDEQKLKAVGDLGAHLQTLQQNEEKMADKFQSIQLENEQIRSQSRQLQSDVEKLSSGISAGSYHNQTKTMVVEETSRRIIKPAVPVAQERFRDADANYQEVTPRSRDRAERPCGIPAVWDLCSDRPAEVDVVGKDRGRNPYNDEVISEGEAFPVRRTANSQERKQ